MISPLLSPVPLTSRGGPGTIKDIDMTDIREDQEVKRVAAAKAWDSKAADAAGVTE